ncbi:hypothetical protein SAMN05421821_117102 [Mucilaginibacter lappiensis]|nr:hypothetical protein SAMN05421821_117102 [Mucilaginibacter lappiensis]
MNNKGLPVYREAFVELNKKHEKSNFIIIVCRLTLSIISTAA